MCTAATYRTKDHYFGRTLDYEVSYGEEVVVTPRNFPFHFRHMGGLSQPIMPSSAWQRWRGSIPYTMTPPEKGLSMAGLIFPGNADYKPLAEGKDNVATFELIPWLLGQCATVEEAKAYLARMNLANTPFGSQFPVSPLHWIIADRDCCHHSGIRAGGHSDL